MLHELTVNMEVRICEDGCHKWLDPPGAGGSHVFGCIMPCFWKPWLHVRFLRATWLASVCDLVALLGLAEPGVPCVHMTAVLIPQYHTHVAAMTTLCSKQGPCSRTHPTTLCKQAERFISSS